MTKSIKTPERLHLLEPAALQLLVIWQVAAIGRQLDLAADLGLGLADVDEDIDRPADHHNGQQHDRYRALRADAQQVMGPVPD